VLEEGLELLHRDGKRVDAIRRAVDKVLRMARRRDFASPHVHGQRIDSLVDFTIFHLKQHIVAHVCRGHVDVHVVPSIGVTRSQNEMVVFHRMTRRVLLCC